MKQFVSCYNRNKILFNYVLFIPLLFCSQLIIAQPSAYFSGLWIMDNSKSDEQFGEYEITLSIKQDSQTITLQKTFVNKGGKKRS